MLDTSAPRIPANRIVVVMPNWLGDGVMATPFLRALRGLYPGAHIAVAARPLVAPVCAGLVDQVEVFGKGEEAATARWMRGGKFELGVLLPNSFRSAWTLWRGRVKRRLGYARGGRSLLLTDRVQPVRKQLQQRCLDEAVRIGIQLAKFEEPVCDGELIGVKVIPGRWGNQRWVLHRMRSTGEIVRKRLTAYQLDNTIDAKVLRADFQPVPTIVYYLTLAGYLGAVDPSPRMALGEGAKEQEEAAAALSQMGLGDQGAESSGNSGPPSARFVVIVPGANFGSSKCWMPERFAAVAQTLADPAGAFQVRVILAGSPGETPICEAIASAMKMHRERVIILGAVNGGKGVSIGALKEIVRRSRMMICNDTGPRHIAAALGVPVVTLFGPTDPVWAETFFEKERIVRVEVPCGPCQLKACPIDHRCMKGISVEMVLAAVRELWDLGP